MDSAQNTYSVIYSERVVLGDELVPASVHYEYVIRRHVVQADEKSLVAILISGMAW